MPADEDRRPDALEPRCACPAGPSPAERRAAGLAHASALLMFFLPLGNVLGPLLFLVYGSRRSAFVAGHAAQALVYQTAVASIAWGLLLMGYIRGFGEGPHLAALAISLGPSAWAFARALRGRREALPMVGSLARRLSSSP